LQAKTLCFISIIIIAAICFTVGYYTANSQGGSNFNQRTISDPNKKIEELGNNLAQAKADNTKFREQIEQGTELNRAAIGTATEAAGIIQQGAGENQSVIATANGLSGLIKKSQSNCRSASRDNIQVTRDISECLRILENAGK
jgi:hypothetical protein